MTPRQQEDHRLTQYLNKLLDEMPLSEPSSHLTDRIMRGMQEEDRVSLVPKTPMRQQAYWINGSIAIAATIVLIQSGIIGKIMNIDTGIMQLTTFIQHLSQ
ncbi:hypothetical protein LOZ80_38285 [Paenibacillus sp. HWE-109]|uniref:hypothetical protein n=1 Tax=Paenibacillus sp. HWE-109 TaxID=1306526 RepID=UPI001EDD7E84|nr:hypothetical protein [Paenibacillus sp. HWE-109]UKS27238.1 hypothetical protein LOZ80_38285 [Paenibacillus sp. HWE-109]